MSDTPKHTKITTYEELPDGSFKKKTVKYHELMAAIDHGGHHRYLGYLLAQDFLKYL